MTSLTYFLQSVHNTRSEPLPLPGLLFESQSAAARPAVVILGDAASGKSTLSGSLVLQELAGDPDLSVRVIESGTSNPDDLSPYEFLAAAAGARTARSVNPLAIPHPTDRDLDNLIALLGIILEKQESIPSCMEAPMREVLEECLANPPANGQLTLAEVAILLMHHPDDRLQGYGCRLGTLLQGPLGRLLGLPYQGEVGLEGYAEQSQGDSFIHYDFSDVSIRWRKVCYFAAACEAQRHARSSLRRQVLVIDELWHLGQSDPGSLLLEVLADATTTNQAVIFTASSPRDIWDATLRRRVMTSTNQVVLHARGRKELARALNLSAPEVAEVKEFRPGDALLVRGHSRERTRVELPSAYRWLLTTEFEEVTRRSIVLEHLGDPVSAVAWLVDNWGGVERLGETVRRFVRSSDINERLWMGLAKLSPAERTRRVRDLGDRMHLSDSDFRVFAAAVDRALSVDRSVTTPLAEAA